MTLRQRMNEARLALVRLMIEECVAEIPDIVKAIGEGRLGGGAMFRLHQKLDALRTIEADLVNLVIDGGR